MRREPSRQHPSASTGPFPSLNVALEGAYGLWCAFMLARSFAMLAREFIAPAELPLKERKLYWHHPGIYLVIVINVLLYLIVALATRKKVAVAPGLCMAHAKRRKLGIAIAWTGLAAGLVLVSVGAVEGPEFLPIIGIVLILASVITGMLMARVLYPKIIDERGAHLKGAGEEFLSSLPSTTDWIRM